jgi:fibronectin type 3 domain-containing protein
MSYTKIGWIAVLLVIIESVSALFVALDSPMNNTFSPSKDVLLSYSAQEIENITSCCIFVNSEQKQCNESTILQKNSFNLNLGEGTFEWYVRCSNSLQSVNSVSRIFSVDSISPDVSVLSPMIGSWQSGVIQIVHKESDANIKDCSYGYSTSLWQVINCNVSFDFDTSRCIDGTNSCVLQLRAVDKAGNENSHLLVFSVDNRYPTAAITLSDASPLREGTVEVTVQASEEILGTPELMYSLDNAPSILQPISLSGSGRLWKGYMIISNVGTRVGTFYFKGYDIARNNGSLITDGKLFLVDTDKPAAPQSIKLTRQDNDDIKVEWYYDGEAAVHFVVYKSTDGNVEYVDQVATTQNMNYLDTEVDDDETYYYRISAVDAAGNNGALSSQVAISPEQQQVIQEESIEQNKVTQKQVQELTKQEIQQQPLTPSKPKESDIMIKDYLNEVNKLSVDISWVISNFQNKEDVVEKHLITDLELSVQVSNAQLDVEKLRNELLQLQSSSESEDYKLRQLTMTELTLKKIRQTTPKNINIREKNEFIQSITDDDIKSAIEETIGQNKNFSVFVRNNYYDSATFIQPQVNVNTEVDVFTLEYLDKSKINKTVVTKKVVYQSPDTLKNVVLVELIPKSIVFHVNDMDIKTSGYQVLREDPVLLWKFGSFNYEEKQIRYIINEAVDVSRIKGIKSVIMKDPEYFLSGEDSTKISGFSIFSFGGKSGLLGRTSSISVVIGFVVVILLSGYYFIFIKSFDSMPLVSKVTISSSMRKEIRALLQEAHDYLDIEDIARARLLYPKIKNIYGKLPDSQRPEYYDKCVELYSRIISLTKK